MRKRLTSILVKPAGPDCNLACSYCFYSGKSALFAPGPHRMSDEVLEALFRQAFAAAPEGVTFIWQGGEPTVMGLDFFRRAVELQERLGGGVPFDNCFQTNGILLDGQWARFLAEKKFLVGLSLDGDRHVHDRYRVDRGGGPTWEKVMDGVVLLQNAGVAYNVVAVVNDYSQKFGAETYDFFLSRKLAFMQFIPCLEPDPLDPSRPAPFSATPKEYGEFLCAVYDRWRRDFIQGVPMTMVRFFEDLFFIYAGAEPPDCTLLPTCGNYLAVEHDGSVYPCDFFVEPSLKLGNVREDSLDGLLNGEQQLAFGRRKAGLPRKCLDCRWLEFCRGGCPRERGLGENGVNYFCRSFRIFLDHADKDFKRMAQRWNQQLADAQPSPAPPQSPGRNAPCPCGSGRKYKKCCGR